MGAGDEIAVSPASGRVTGYSGLGIVGIQECADACHWERISQPWELLATPLGAVPFHNRKTFLATPNCILYHESFASRLKVHALSPEGMVAFAVAVRPGARTSWFGRPLHERGLPETLPGGVEALLEAGQEHIMLLIRQTLLRRYLSAEQYAGLEAAASSRLLPAGAETQAELADWLTGLLTRTHGAPEMLRHPAVIAALETELVNGLARILRLTEVEHRAPRSLRRRGFDRAIACIRHADLATLDTAELCAAAAVSARTLEYAFREELGLSPAAFIRRLRLHALRRALLASALGESTVTELAYQLGFTQLGRLAGTYRRTFGETPSATLAHPYHDEAPRLLATQPVRTADGIGIAVRG
jgi:AraC-like DNA-binding protein